MKLSKFQCVLTIKQKSTCVVRILGMFLENAKLASVHGEPIVVTTVHLVIMDLDVVIGAVVVIGRYAIPNKDVLNHLRVTELRIV